MDCHQTWPMTIQNKSGSGAVRGAANLDSGLCRHMPPPGHYELIMYINSVRYTWWRILLAWLIFVISYAIHANEKMSFSH